ncbi:unnamed protein product [Rotaria sp. Silwood1]|nr:unnamed protein product [Rotaria sp. Silwood1]CAF3329028.1 unnamed protein product [Rotaria sp. Silwood1]CAF3361586.1 unnamed protein product [Rotaria sp. Silwood1]CAF4511509.1 unnamed protein product [Rotaria sp. Silwood1]CAF4661224.1 unnamed protein product [Rotaria sp. Silwood1]
MAQKKHKPTSKSPKTRASSSGKKKKNIKKISVGRGVRKDGIKKAKSKIKKSNIKKKLVPKKSKSKINIKKSKPNKKKSKTTFKSTGNKNKPKKLHKKIIKKPSKANLKRSKKPSKINIKNLNKHKTKKSFEPEEIPVIKGSEVIQGRKLGEGGFGKVVEGTFRGRIVAVKIPLRKEDFEEALIEFKKLRNFRHRNVVEAIAYCKDPAMFIMEYMAGGTLNSWLHDGNNKYIPMNWFQGVRLLTDISRGIKLLHDASLLHGDLSSNNVLLIRDHTVAKISDFGTVQMIEKYINASLAGQIDEAVGAFRWMAPQRLRFSKPDNYSDVWSYGCILIEFLTHPRKIPFAAASTAQLIAKLENYVEGDIRDLRIDLGEMDPDAPLLLQEFGSQSKMKTNSKRVHSSDVRTWR